MHQASTLNLKLCHIYKLIFLGSDGNDLMTGSDFCIFWYNLELKKNNQALEVKSLKKEKKSDTAQITFKTVTDCQVSCIQ